MRSILCTGPSSGIPPTLCYMRRQYRLEALGNNLSVPLSLICAGGAGFPEVESLEDLYNWLILVFFTLGGDPRNPPFPPGALRGLFEGSCRRGCRSKLEIPYIMYHISWLRACFDSPSGRSPRRALKELRRVKGFGKKGLSVRGLEHSNFFKKDPLFL